jgi:hypothetical protein
MTVVEKVVEMVVDKVVEMAVEMVVEMVVEMAVEMAAETVVEVSVILSSSQRNLLYMIPLLHNYYHLQHLMQSVYNLHMFLCMAWGCIVFHSDGLTRIRKYTN